MGGAGTDTGARHFTMAGPRKIQPEAQQERLGRRIRRRRLFLKKTQAELAQSLGITYQQLQKYESGLNRVPENRLRDIADLLEVAPDYFSASRPSAPNAETLERFVESPQGTELIRAVAGLSETERARLILAVGYYCESPLRAGDAETLLTSWLRKTTSRRGTAEIAGDADVLVQAAKIELARLLGKTLRTRKMTQAFAAQILGTGQARLSRLARGDVKGVSLDKLLRYLLLLGWDIGLDAARRPADRPGKVGVTSRDPGTQK